MAKVNSDAIKHTGGAPRTALALPEHAAWFVPSNWLDQDCGAVIADEINMLVGTAVFFNVVEHKAPLVVQCD